MRRTNRYIKSKRYNKSRKRYYKAMRGGEEPPTTLDNVKKVTDIGLQLSNNIAAAGINYAENKVKDLAENIGIDTDNNIQEEVKELGKKVSEIKEAINTPEGQQAIQDLQSVATELGEEVLGPGLKKTAEIMVDASGPIMNKGAKAVLDGISATPIGPIVEIPRFIADIGGIFQDGTAMVADVMNVARESLDTTIGKTDKIKNAWGKLQNAVDVGNKALATGLDKLESRVDNFGSNVVRKSNMNNIIQSGGVAFKDYKKQIKMIGGRTRKSQIEFLRPRLRAESINMKYRSRKRH